MKNIIDLIQKMEEKEIIDNGARYIELLEKAVSNLSYDEQLEFEELYEERNTLFIENMQDIHKELIELENIYNKNMDDISERLKGLL